MIKTISLMIMTISIFAPIIAGLYGALVGAYHHSKTRSPGKRMALWATGVLLLTIYIVLMVIAFRG